MKKGKNAPSIDMSSGTFSPDLAIRLLYVQQRIDALERLYNEELSSLKKDVSDVKREYVRQAQASGRLHEQTGPPAPPEPDEEDKEP